MIKLDREQIGYLEGMVEYGRIPVKLAIELYNWAEKLGKIPINDRALTKKEMDVLSEVDNWALLGIGRADIQIQRVGTTLQVYGRNIGGWVQVAPWLGGQR